MILIMIAASILAQAAGPERDAGFTYTRPAGWSRSPGPEGTITLAPPGLATGERCNVTLIAPQEFSGTAQAWHQRLWKELTQEYTVVSQSEARKFGAFLATTGTLRDAQGTSGFFTLYSALEGTRGMAAVFGAGSEALAKKHAPTVTAMLEKAQLGIAPGAAPAPGRSVTVGGLQISLADGWTAQPDPNNGWTRVIPPGVANLADACAFCRGEIPIEGTLWATHRKLWASLAAGGGMKDEDPVITTPDGPGDFVHTSGRWRQNPTSAPYVHLYSARSGKSLVAVLYMGTAAGIVSEHTFPLERMLRTAVIKEPATRTMPAVAEAYHSVGERRTIYRDGTNWVTLHSERIVLLENGVVDFCLAHEEGYDAYPFWKIDPDLNDATFGRWRASGNDVELTRGDKTSVYVREGGTLRSGRRVWKPMPKLDGLRLKGRFARKSQPNDAVAFCHWIEFAPDGTFSMEHILRTPIVEGRPQQPPEKGSGTYEIRNWTLRLKLSDEFAQSQDFMIMDDDVKNPSAVWLRTYLYSREK